MILLTDSTNLISSDDIMDDTKLNLIMRCFDSLKVKMTEEELSTFILDNDFSNTDIDAVLRMFSFLEKRSNEASIQMMLRLSKLPLKSPKTFANFQSGSWQECQPARGLAVALHAVFAQECCSDWPCGYRKDAHCNGLRLRMLPAQAQDLLH